MVSFPEALKFLLAAAPVAATERCRLENAQGRVLRENVMADRAVPAFDRVMMDGYALRSDDWAAGQRIFPVSGSAPAGRAMVTTEAGTCVEVMTGAPCPLGADCIVPVEDVMGTDGGVVEISESAAPVAGRFIHRCGSDAVVGQILLEAGCLMGSREIGVAASCGAGWLEVSCMPRIAVVATGDELVGVDEIPAPHQIRQSNAHSISAALKSGGYAPSYVGVMGDDECDAKRAMEELLAAQEWVILTGAVSMGSRDFVPSLLRELGCCKLFHGVAHRPGKPAGSWIGPRGQMIIALPGNPVSALVGTHTLVIPALAHSVGLKKSVPRWVTMVDLSMQLSGFTWHLPVRLCADGRVEAAAVGNSGDFIGLLKSDGFITLPPRGEVSAAFPFTPWL